MPCTTFENLLMQEAINKGSESDLVFFIFAYYSVVKGHESNQFNTTPFDLNNIKFLNFEGISNYLDVIVEKGTFSIHFDADACKKMQKLSTTQIFNISGDPQKLCEFKKFTKLWIDKSLWYFPNEITVGNGKMSSTVGYDDEKQVLSMHFSKAVTVFFKSAIGRGYEDGKEITEQNLEDSNSCVEIQETLLRRFIAQQKLGGIIEVENEEISHICLGIIQYWLKRQDDKSNLSDELGVMKQFLTTASRFPEL